MGCSKEETGRRRRRRRKKKGGGAQRLTGERCLFTLNTHSKSSIPLAVQPTWADVDIIVNLAAPIIRPFVYSTTVTYSWGIGAFVVGRKQYVWK